eukprot:TRINITY_DN521_c0_g2_i1.p1 TRINITY_DN521_c0_g2~~TRINITY_DN521_c0_g2_i1.p1  ORF type:complete len:307 (+),score=17.19 TRINITY_DN521_c0_g2_i1:252-1172(+)
MRKCSTFPAEEEHQNVPKPSKRKKKQENEAEPSNARKRKKKSENEAEPSNRGKRKKKSENAAEKRLKRFIRRPTKSVEERIQRAYEHRLYLIDRKSRPPHACDFIVLGATGNVYTVSLSQLPTCTCPDFQRGNTCKHILFVMLRVLKLSPEDPRVWQKAFLASELEDLLNAADAAESSVMANRRVRERFLEISGSNPDEGHGESTRRSLEGDCPVCYEPLQGAKEDVVYCRTCGNNVHKDCFERWSRSKHGGPVTCVYCRAPWEKEKENAKGKYVNLAAYSDVHRSEDLSLKAFYPESSHWIRWRR